MTKFRMRHENDCPQLGVWDFSDDVRWRVHARKDGRYSQFPLKAWFHGLRSDKGLCCSDADGFAVSDPDWELNNGHYRVRVDNE